MMRNAPNQRKTSGACSESASASPRIFSVVPPGAPGGVERRYRERRERVYTPEEIRAEERDKDLALAVRDEDGLLIPEFERATRGDSAMLRNFRWRCVRALRHGASLESLLAFVDELRLFLVEAARKYGSRRKAA